MTSPAFRMARQNPSPLVGEFGKLAAVFAGSSIPLSSRSGGSWSRAWCRAVSLTLVTLLVTATGCGTVDPGTFEGVRDVRLDDAYFYCVVQPRVLTAKKCAGGEASDGGGCHANTSSMRLVDVPTSVACADGKPTGTPSDAERGNYTASQLRATRDVESSPLLLRPQGKAPHPRVIFDTTAPESDILRTWMRGGR